MKKLLIVLIIVLVITLLAFTLPSRPAYAQDTATPTVTATPAYVMTNTVSVGEYGIAVILSLLCLLITVIALAAGLWGFLQTRKRG